MMDAGYFVSRTEIMDWINETLQLSLSKVEQTASGAVACQLLDRIYPGKVPLSKVNWEAKVDYEFLGNYKVLQNAFTKLKIDKHLPVEKLVRAKYQDNLEFMQWFKRFYELNNPALDYDPVAARAGGKGAARLAGGGAAAASKSSSSSSSSARRPVASSGYAGVRDKENTGSSSGSRSSSYDKSTVSRSSGGSDAAGSSSSSSKAAAPVVDEAMVVKVEMLTQENAQLQATVEGLEKERDFYFEKLTIVEEMLQERQAAAGESAPAEINDLVEQVFKILYATDSASAALAVSGGSEPTATTPAAAADPTSV